jgi:hypothetical protein
MLLPCPTLRRLLSYAAIVNNQQNEALHYSVRSIPSRTSDNMYLVADPLHARRQGVQQEAADKFVGGQSHGFLLVVIGVVLPAEANITVVHIEQAVVAEPDRRSAGADLLIDRAIAYRQLVEQCRDPGIRPRIAPLRAAIFTARSEVSSAAPDLIDVTQQIRRILVHADRARTLELIRPIAA